MVLNNEKYAGIDVQQIWSERLGQHAPGVNVFADKTISITQKPSQPH